MSVIEHILNYKNNLELQIEFLDELLENPKHFFQLLDYLNNKNPEYKKKLIEHYSTFIKDSVKKSNLQHIELFKFVLDNKLFIEELEFEQFKLFYEKNIISIDDFFNFVKKTNSDDETTFVIDILNNNQEFNINSIHIEFLFKNKKTFTLLNNFLSQRNLNMKTVPFKFNQKVLKNKYFEILK